MPRLGRSRRGLAGTVGVDGVVVTHAPTRWQADCYFLDIALRTTGLAVVGAIRTMS